MQILNLSGCFPLFGIYIKVEINEVEIISPTKIEKLIVYHSRVKNVTLSHMVFEYTQTFSISYPDSIRLTNFFIFYLLTPVKYRIVCKEL